MCSLYVCIVCVYFMCVQSGVDTLTFFPKYAWSFLSKKKIMKKHFKKEFFIIYLFFDPQISAKKKIYIFDEWKNAFKKNCDERRRKKWWICFSEKM